MNIYFFAVNFLCSFSLQSKAFLIYDQNKQQLFRFYSQEQQRTPLCLVP